MAHIGVIKSFNPDKGWGFIECEETAAKFGKDMFVLQKHVRGGTAQKGAPVSFNVIEEHNGPVAVDVTITNGMYAAPAPPARSSRPAFSGKGYEKGNGGYGYEKGKGRGHDDLSAYVSYIGMVKSFNQMKGYGMIECPATHAMHGKDVFLPGSLVPGGNVGPGTEVRFTIAMEPKGPAAASLEVLPGGQYQRPPPQAYPQAATQRWSPAPPPPPPPQWLAPPAPAPARQANPNQIYIGTLKSFNTEKGWGHIACDSTFQLYGKDIFVLSGALQGVEPVPGSLMAFKVHVEQKGPQASNITLIPPGTLRKDGEEGKLFTGSIKTFNKEKGWGFVTCSELLEIFGKDIFIHAREFGAPGADVPDVGAELSFFVELDNRAQPVAKLLGLGEVGFEPAAPPKLTSDRAVPY